MVNEVVKELEAARAKVAELENTLASERRQALAGLPKEHGFGSIDDFIKAVKDASGSNSRARSTTPSSPRGRAKTAAKPAPAGKRRGKRARITPEVKENVKSLVQDGRTGAQIAKELGISVPSVQNIKKEFGLVKARG